MQAFEAIRPYKDSEAPAALDRLINDREFLDLIGRFKAPTFTRLAPGVARVLTKRCGNLAVLSRLMHCRKSLQGMSAN